MWKDESMNGLGKRMAPPQPECIGMWCDTQYGLGVLVDVEGNVDETVLHILVPHTRAAIIAKGNDADITLRHDLPRAWTPDGMPASTYKGDEESSLELIRGRHRVM